eukprot:CAMPEP_0201564776 /NCGR_PEP_ID=MMETSP0190_2-20130828/3341_1 /ASSEMBLY_ACC=CAM_ASM_000263 /TAXON_ID=37353 /ORGANISM="Rosalina sp." /LENGTH=41 /DNA_ID= /DNA_START= /DNA_END= /DNA_ORIENTATION=
MVNSINEDSIADSNGHDGVGSDTPNSTNGQYDMDPLEVEVQ